MFAAGILILLLTNMQNVITNIQQTKNTVVSAAYNGYSHLLQGGNQAQKTNFDQAGSSFTQASGNFQSALDTIAFLNSNQSTFSTAPKTVQSAQALLEAGKNLSQAGVDFAKGIDGLRTLPQIFLERNRESFQGVSLTSESKPTSPIPSTDASGKSISLTGIFQKDLEFLEHATLKVEVASDNIALVDETVLPKNLQPKFKELQSKIETLKNLLHQVQEKIPVLMKLLGDRYLHRYLILLQNDTEARPTGGFIGSYLVVDVSDGQIIQAKFEDVYARDGQLKEFVQAPEDIARITKNWRLRDSNYSPDFAISAEKAAWFLQKERGPSVDTVIAVNQHFLASFFDLTGPISLEGLPAALTKENYQTVISYIVESKLSGKEDPKKILRRFIPEFQKKLFSTAAWGSIVTKLLNGAHEGDVLFYSRDAEIQAVFHELGLDGKILRTDNNEDYLDVITTSIGGNKSDLYIRQDLIHTTLIDAQGTLKNQLTITRNHTWNSDTFRQVSQTLKSFGFEEISEEVTFILGAGRNRSVMKVYVPKGSVLLGSDGIAADDVLLREDDELQKTYFMFEMSVEPGSQNTVTLTYQLPQKLDLFPVDTYKLNVQRQPGLAVSRIEKNIVVNPGLKFHEQYPETFQKNENGGLTLSRKLEKDFYLSALVGD